MINATSFIRRFDKNISFSDNALFEMFELPRATEFGINGYMIKRMNGKSISVLMLRLRRNDNSKARYFEVSIDSENSNADYKIDFRTAVYKIMEMQKMRSMNGDIVFIQK